MGSSDMQPMTRSKLPLQTFQPLKKSKVNFPFFQRKNLAIIMGYLWAPQRHKTKYSISIQYSVNHTISNKGVSQGSVNFIQDVPWEICVALYSWDIRRFFWYAIGDHPRKLPL